MKLEKCRECGGWHPLDPDKRCEICAPRSRSSAPGRLVYTAVARGGQRTIEFDSMEHGFSLYFQKSPDKIFHITIEEIPRG